MAHNKEQLDKLLIFLKQLIEEPGNGEFVQQLQELLYASSSSTDKNSKICKIEEYLGLDYKLDTLTPVIDYSFVDVENVRDQLESDFREMLRYRYGVRSHKIDFSEFCRYAILQVEQLLNYYYSKKFSSLDEVKIYLQENIEWAEIGNIEMLSAIPLKFKLIPVIENNRWLTDILDNARQVRNSQSHRGTDDNNKKITIIRAKLEEKGFPLTKDGKISWNEIKDDIKMIQIFNNEIGRKNYQNYTFTLWCGSLPFDDVIEAIRRVSQKIRYLLADK